MATTAGIVRVDSPADLDHLNLRDGTVLAQH
jgi:hypothetical protein